jgi:hypothetical protein
LEPSFLHTREIPEKVDDDTEYDSEEDISSIEIERNKEESKPQEYIVKWVDLNLSENLDPIKSEDDTSDAIEYGWNKWYIFSLCYEDRCIESCENKPDKIREWMRKSTSSEGIAKVRKYPNTETERAEKWDEDFGWHGIENYRMNSW